MRRRRAAMALRRRVPLAGPRDEFVEAEMRADVRRMLLDLTPRLRAALLLVDLLGYRWEQAVRITRVRPSTVRNLTSQGRVDGTLLFIQAEIHKRYALHRVLPVRPKSGLEQEIQQIVESTRFD